MASYSLQFRKSVAKDLRSIPNKDVVKILQRIELLAIDPRPAGSEKLSAQSKYRIRQGVYRIIYEIKDSELVVLIVKAGHRKNIYESR
ncbi:MAG: type II toxin-antitoxin system RelE/ParE family toxin [Proteobacteria bacterium]|nr:type II toxin-antitoxin system RelE/ParE family toxin [Pseudomonadota bacterium]